MSKRKQNGRGYLKPYKSYVFRNKDPVIDIMRTAVQDSKESYQSISDGSGVSTTTLYNWFDGKTRRPQFSTVQAVAMAIDRKFVLMKKNGR